MNDQTRTRWFWILAILGTTITVIAIVVFFSSQNKKSPFYTTKLVDRDTGETLFSQPNQIPEAAATGYVVVFGSHVLFEGGATEAQFKLIQQALTDYAKQKLGNQYDTLTIIPKGFAANAGSMTGQLRLGQTSKIVDLKARVWQAKYAEVIIQDSSGQNGGNYDSGQLTIPASSQQ